MKRLLLLLLLANSFSSNAQHQSDSKFDGVLVFRNAKTVLNELLSKRNSNLVSTDKNSFTISYSHIGYVEIKKFIYNPIDSVIYKMVGIVPEQEFVKPFVYYGMLKENLVRQTNYMPYEYNDDPKAGEVYAKWQIGSSFITISVNYRNEVVYVDESLLEDNMFKFYYNKPTR